MSRVRYRSWNAAFATFTLLVVEAPEDFSVEEGALRYPNARRRDMCVRRDVSLAWRASDRVGDAGDSGTFAEYEEGGKSERGENSCEKTDCVRSDD